MAHAAIAATDLVCSVTTGHYGSLFLADHREFLHITPCMLPPGTTRGSRFQNSLPKEKNDACQIGMMLRDAACTCVAHVLC
jgi:hypothetical protein